MENGQNQNKKILEAWIQKNIPRLYNYCFHLTLQEEPAISLCRASFSKVIPSILKNPENPASLAILYREITKIWIKNEKTEAPPIPGTQEFQDLLVALGKLEPEEKALIILKDMENCSYEEIQSIVDKPIKTLQDKLTTARDKLRTLHHRIEGKLF